MFFMFSFVNIIRYFFLFLMSFWKMDIVFILIVSIGGFIYILLVRIIYKIGYLLDLRERENCVLFEVKIR